jgi:hypothetical protein
MKGVSGLQKNGILILPVYEPVRGLLLGRKLNKWFLQMILPSSTHLQACMI